MPPPSLWDYLRPQSQPLPFEPFNSRVTYYAPGPGDRMEGGFETSRPNPQTGKRVPSTLDDVRMGVSPFVTLAGDPSRYGQTVKMGPLTYTSPIDQQSYTLPDVTGYVHDTGSAFKGRPDKLDVATGDFRGWSPQAASALVTDDAGRRTVTPLQGDEADQAMRPIGLPEAWRATGEGYDQTAVAEGPPQQRRKAMPESLLDMFQPRSTVDNSPIGFGDAIAQNRNALMGLGMGLLQPRSMAVGAPTGTAWTNAMQGYMQGAQADSTQAYRQQALAHQKTQDARQAAMDKFNMGMREKEYVRSGEGEFERLMRAQGVTPGSPEFIENAKRYALGKIEGDWEARDIIDPSDPDGERKMTVERNKRTGEFRLPTLPGQTGTAAAPPVNWSGGNAPVYGSGQSGFSATPQAAPGAAAAAAADRHAITLPNGDVVRPPPGANKEARKAWAADVSKTVADMQTGKMTEAQGTKAIYAAGMELAQQELEKSSHLGTSPQGKGLGALPFGIGAAFQSNEYQNYRNAKDAWLNAKLRAESGATINPDEFARDDRIYFPQPGEGEQQIAAKKVLREYITQNTKRAAGPGYKSPPSREVPSASGGGNAAGGIPPPPPGFILRQSNR